MNTYTKQQILKAAKLGEVSMIDARHIVSLLDEVEESELPKCRKCKAPKTINEVGYFECVKCDNEKPYEDD
jgi:hypothetical protein